MDWADVKHQDAALQRLDQALRGGRLPHAYVFAGPEGVGKRMAAVRLARRLLCSRGPGLSGRASGHAAAREADELDSGRASAIAQSDPPQREPAQSDSDASLFGGGGGGDGGGLFAAEASVTVSTDSGPSSKSKSASARAAARTAAAQAGRSDASVGQPAAASSDESVPAPPAGGWPADACGVCDDCVAVAAGSHVDLHLVDRRLNRHHPDPVVRRRKGLDLGVDVIRTFVTERVSRFAARGLAKVFIIDEAERMNANAENALLKTLEEPPGDAVLILITTSVERLLPTTRSRCQTVEFRRLPDDFVRRQVATRTSLPERDAAYLAAVADGRLGPALRYAAAELHAQREAVFGLLQTARADPPAFSRAAQEMVKGLIVPDAEVESSDDAEDDDDEDNAPAVNASAARDARVLLLAMLAHALRESLHAALGLPGPAAGDRPSSTPLRIAATAAARAVRALSAAEADLERQANVALVFDALGIELSRAFAGRPALV